MKKWLAALLAVMLLALPLSGLAESPDELMEKALDAGLTLETQISLIPGNLPLARYQHPVSDLLSALSIYQLSSREGPQRLCPAAVGQGCLPRGLGRHRRPLLRTQQLAG